MSTINNPPSPINKIAQINRLLQLDNLKEVKELLVLLLRYFPLDIVAGANITIEKDTNFSVYKISSTGSGTSILLQTNGTDNPVQTLLNLVAGTNMTITDDGAGNITFDATGGGGGTYTVNNGLTESPANNFQLGGTLIKNTTINTSTFILNLLGNLIGDAIYKLKNTAAGGLGGVFEADNNAIVAISINGEAIYAFSKSNIESIHGTTQFNGTGDVTVLRADRIASSSGGVGVGASASIDTGISNSVSAPPARTSLKTRWESGVGNYSWELWVTDTNVAYMAFKVSPVGQVRLTRYGVGTFASAAVYLLGVDASGNVVETTASGTGTVTSVAATVPSPTNPAFSVNVPNPTTTPSIDITANGIVSQYIRGDGSLANFPASSGGGASVSYYLNGSVSQGTFGGVSMREMNKVPIIGAGTDFTINADGYIQSFITDANDPNQLLIPAGNWNFELYFSASSSGGSPSFYVELYKWDGATLTLIASSSATPEGITNGTAIDLYTTALAVPQTTLALTDRLAVRVWVNHSGRTITLHTEDNHLCQIITTFTTGLTALNGLTAQVQTFVNDINVTIVSAGTTHTITWAGILSVARGGTGLNALGSPLQYLRVNALGTALEYETFPAIPSIAGLVPYTGANANVDLGAFGLTTNTIDVTTLAAQTTPASKIVTQEGTTLKFRTPAQILTDAGAYGSIIWNTDSIFTASNASGVTYVASQDKLYVPNFSSNNVQIFTASTGVLLATIAVTSAFRTMLITSPIEEIWVSSTTVTTLTRISVTTNTSPGTIAGVALSGWAAVTVSATKVFMICSLASGVISQINPTTATLTANITLNVPSFPTGMAYNTNPSSSQNGFIVISASAGVAIFNATTNVISTTVANPSSAISNGRNIKYVASTNQYILASNGNSTSIILNIATPTTFTVAATLRWFINASDVVIDETNGYYFISSLDATLATLLVNMYSLSTNALLNSWKTNSATNSSDATSSLAIDIPNKRIFALGRRVTNNLCTIVKYL